MEQDKPARILDAAEALLLRLGYRRVVMADVAQRAGVGKGTVYLYWPSKAELFGTVLARESIRQLDGQLAALRADPAECLLHRTHRTSFLLVMRSPLARALYTRDTDTLGELLTGGAAGEQFAAGKADATTGYLTVLHRHGLLADPVADPWLRYRLAAVLAGAFLLEGLPGSDESGIEAKADGLATTLRRAFEPARQPDPAAVGAAAKEITALYETWRDELAAALPR